MGNSCMVQKVDQVGYHFNREGKLVKKSNGEHFTFTNQREYDALGAAVTEDIYNRLEAIGLR